MRDVSPASSVKLKIIYRLKISKTANLVTISIQKFYIYNKYIYIQVLCIMVGGYSQGRGEAMTIPLQATATYYSNNTLTTRSYYIWMLEESFVYYNFLDFSV